MREEPRQQEARNERTDDADDDIANQPKPPPDMTWPASQPATAPMSEKDDKSC